MNSKPKENRSKQRPSDITGGYTENGLSNGLWKNPPDFFIDKPNEPGYKSGIWDNGIGFIYSSSNDAVVPYWYGCTVSGCHRVFNLYLPDGNGKLKRHVDSHQLSAPYTVQKNDFINLLSAATKIGEELGFIPAEALHKIVSSSSALNSSGFPANFEVLMRKSVAEQNTTTATGLSFVFFIVYKLLLSQH